MSTAPPLDSRESMSAQRAAVALHVERLLVRIAAEKAGQPRRHRRRRHAAHRFAGARDVAEQGVSARGLARITRSLLVDRDHAARHRAQHGVGAALRLLERGATGAEILRHGLERAEHREELARRLALERQLALPPRHGVGRGAQCADQVVPAVAPRRRSA